MYLLILCITFQSLCSKGFLRVVVDHFWIFTLPEINIFAPENGWLEYDRFLLGPGLFSGANLLLVSGRGILGYSFRMVLRFFFLEKIQPLEKKKVSSFQYHPGFAGFRGFP